MEKEMRDLLWALVACQRICLSEALARAERPNGQEMRDYRALLNECWAKFRDAQGVANV